MEERIGVGETREESRKIRDGGAKKKLGLRGGENKGGVRLEKGGAENGRGSGAEGGEMEGGQGEGGGGGSGPGGGG